MGGRATSDFPLRKCARREQQYDDRISQLPNEILVYVLSFLKLEDAARTSVLSRRWIHLWKFIPRLDFDASKDFEEVSRVEFDSSSEHRIFCKMRRLKRRKYIEWVDKVLRSHKSTVLDVFRICFDFNKSHRKHIDKWLQYAVARKAQRIEISLGIGGISTPYAFPLGLLGPSLVSGAISGLRALTLDNVLISDEVLEFFLHNCPFLEYLIVVNAGNDLQSVEVCGQSLALRHLEISYCPGLKSLTICDTNIVSLKTTHGHSLVLKNVPMLVDVYIGGCCRRLIRGAISWLSCCLLNLEVLTLQIGMCDAKEEKALDFALPRLAKLKQFTLAADGDKDYSLIPFTCIIRASPNLEKFILELDWGCFIARKSRESKKGIAYPLQHLKVVELRGYYGRRADIELVEYFVENAVSLERIIVDPHDKPLWGPALHKPEKEEIARYLAKQQLELLVPSHVEMVIL